MLLRGTAGDSLALNISGYQFPDAEDLQKRYSWHMVEGGASSATTKWAFRYPALTCDESVTLATWLREVGDTPETSSTLKFTEPNLRFEIVGRSTDSVILEVQLDQEFGHPADVESGRREKTVLRLQLSHQALRIAAQEWMADVDRFPDLLAQ
jgi:hypothetical protein